MEGEPAAFISKPGLQHICGVYIVRALSEPTKNFSNKLKEYILSIHQISDSAVRDKLYDMAQGLPEEPSILEALDRNLKKHGFAGSTNIARLVYLATFSRSLDKPCSLAIKGPSSSGKSFALQAALRYVAPSAFKYVSGLSEMALANSGWDLRGMHLVIGEAAGMPHGRGRTFLRQLMSDGSVSYQTVQSTRDGNKGEALPEVKGPAGVILTTTLSKLHPEDETRFFSVYTDQSPQRIRETLLAKATKGTTVPSDKDLSAWHALHEYCFLSKGKVHIPFLDKLAASMPTSDHRVFRDFEQTVSFIKSHTLLHQNTRERSFTNGSIVSSIADYRAVHELLNVPLSQGLRASVPQHVRDVVCAIQECLTFDEFSNGLNQAQLAQYMGRNPSVVSRNVRTAIDLGFLKNENQQGPGRQALIVNGDVPMPSGHVLPSPEELEALCR